MVRVIEEPTTAYHLREEQGTTCQSGRQKKQRRDGRQVSRLLCARSVEVDIRAAEQERDAPEAVGVPRDVPVHDDCEERGVERFDHKRLDGD